MAQLQYGLRGHGSPVAQAGQAALHHVTVEAMPHDGGSLFAQQGHDHAVGVALSRYHQNRSPHTAP